MTVDQIERDNEEIEISNELQEKLNLKEGDKLIVKKVKGRLVMKKNLTVEDLLDGPILGKKSTKEIEEELIALKEKITLFKGKYNCSFDEFEKDVKTKEEDFEKWDDYIEWKAYIETQKTLTEIDNIQEY